MADYPRKLSEVSYPKAADESKAFWGVGSERGACWVGYFYTECNGNSSKAASQTVSDRSVPVKWVGSAINPAFESTAGTD